MIDIAEKYISKYSCDALLLGCTENPLMIKPGDVSVPVIDTTKIHVEKICRLIEKVWPFDKVPDFIDTQRKYNKKYIFDKEKSIKVKSLGNISKLRYNIDILIRTCSFC